MCDSYSSTGYTFYSDSSGSDPSGTGFAPSVEDACGADVSVADLNSTEYIGLFSDAIGLLNNNETGSPFEAVIPAEDIETQCEVRQSHRPVHCLLG